MITNVRLSSSNLENKFEASDVKYAGILSTMTHVLIRARRILIKLI